MAKLLIYITFVSSRRRFFFRSFNLFSWLNRSVWLPLLLMVVAVVKVADPGAKMVDRVAIDAIGQRSSVRTALWLRTF